MMTAKSTPMDLALGEARLAAERGEVPVGAVIVDAVSGQVIAAAGNRTEEDNDPTAHAELLAIRHATGNEARTRLENCDLYVTLEPCAMCAAAISLARIRRLYFAAYDPKSGGVEHGAKVYEHATCHHRPEVIGGLSESEAAGLLKDFFKGKR
jgi:tRNA(Arg) A34 adenosine deaminase TadA